jgi:hypothetical protein
MKRAVEENVVIEEDGFIELSDLPVKAGDRVKVILLIDEANGETRQLYPLRGAAPYRFDDPTAPVAPDDWESGQ